MDCILLDGPGRLGDETEEYLKKKDVTVIQASLKGSAKNTLLGMAGLQVKVLALVISMDPSDRDISIGELAKSLADCREHFKKIPIILVLKPRYCLEFFERTEENFSYTGDECRVAIKKIRVICQKSKIDWLLFQPSLAGFCLDTVLRACLDFPGCTFQDTFWETNWEV